MFLHMETTFFYTKLLNETFNGKIFGQKELTVLSSGGSFQLLMNICSCSYVVSAYSAMAWSRCPK